MKVIFYSFLKYQAHEHNQRVIPEITLTIHFPVKFSYTQFSFL